MSAWTATVGHELLCLRRERLPHLLLAVFVGMTAAAAFVGSSARATVSAVYREAAAQQLTSAANPFDALPPLYYARNTVVYVVLIGALLAIVVGVRSTLRDRHARTTDLILARPGSPAGYLGAKLAGTALAMLGLMAASALISIACVSAVAGHLLGLGDCARLAALYGLGWLFLLPFIALGMLSGTYSRTAATALLLPIVLWSVVVFVLPLLGTAAHPVSLLNPVAPPPADRTGLFALTAALTAPLSLGEQFKQAASALLGGPQAAADPAGGLLTLTTAAALGCAAVVATRRSRTRSALHD